MLLQNEAQVGHFDRFIFRNNLKNDDKWAKSAFSGFYPANSPSRINGLLFRSKPMVVSGPWPE